MGLKSSQKSELGIKYDIQDRPIDWTNNSDAQAAVAKFHQDLK